MNVTIYGHNQCMYCKEAKKECESRDVAVDYLNLMDDPQYHEDLEELIGRVKTIPQIFIDGEHIGGYRELMEVLNG